MAKIRGKRDETIIFQSGKAIPSDLRVMWVTHSEAFLNLAMRKTKMIIYVHVVYESTRTGFLLGIVVFLNNESTDAFNTIND